MARRARGSTGRPHLRGRLRGIPTARRSPPALTAVLAALGVALAVPAGPLRAQSLLERSANVSGDWVGAPGTLQFNFLHRFTHAAPPTRKVTSSPTFLVAASLPWHTLAGFNYATNSDIAPGYPNEWEAFGRFAPISQDAGALLDVGAQAGYNVAARSTDGELSVGRRIGPLQLRGAARVLSNAFDLGTVRTALAGGGILRIGRWLGVAGDFAGLLDRPPGYRNAWSAGVQLAIPYTPHTLSLHVTNTSTATLEGVSAARGTERRYGFEFTIPLTLRRYFAHPAPPVVRDSGVVALVPSVASPTPMPAAPPARDTTPVHVDSVRPAIDSVPAASTSAPAARPPARRTPTRVGMKQGAFTPSKIDIVAGGTVSWTNRDPIVHTVTGDSGWDSGPVEPGATWSRRFDRPGRYTFHCTPHPFMTGVIVVRAANP